jgi:hypothetical protein
MTRPKRKTNRRLLVPSHPDLSRTVIEPLVFFLAIAAFLAIIITIGTALT